MTGELVVAALALSVAFGVSPYATVALLGLSHAIGWIPAPPGLLAGVVHPWVIALAVVLTIVEFIATLVPGVASAWEGLHTMLRPPAAAAMAVLATWGGDPALVIATALLGGSLAFGTSLTKLGARLAIDTSPEPVSNGAASVAELTLVGLISVFVWTYPVVALCLAVLLVAVTALVVRAVWGLIWSTVRRGRRPGTRTIRS